MKKYLSMLRTAAIGLALFSCKKENSTAETASPRVKTTTYPNNTVYTFEYDKDGIRKGSMSTAGSKSENIVTATNVQETFYNPNGTVAQVDYYDLDANKRVIHSTNNNAPGYSLEYTYTADGLVATRFRKFNGTVVREQYLFYKDGNLVTDSLVQGSNWSVSKYEYFTDKTNTLDFLNFGMPYFGATSKNCVKKLTATYSSSPTQVYDYAVPVMDAKGRVIQVSYSKNNGPAQVTTYTYY